MPFNIIFGDPKKQKKKKAERLRPKRRICKICHRPFERDPKEKSREIICDRPWKVQDVNAGAQSTCKLINKARKEKLRRRKIKAPKGIRGMLGI